MTISLMPCLWCRWGRPTPPSRRRGLWAAGSRRPSPTCWPGHAAAGPASAAPDIQRKSWRRPMSLCCQSCPTQPLRAAAGCWGSPSPRRRVWQRCPCCQVMMAKRLWPPRLEERRPLHSPFSLTLSVSISLSPCRSLCLFLSFFLSLSLPLLT